MKRGLLCVGLLAFTFAGSDALANTVTQNTSWTIDRAGTTAKYRITAYGDSIYAGYRGSISNVAKRAAPWSDGEYMSQLWNADWWSINGAWLPGPMMRWSALRGLQARLTPRERTLPTGSRRCKGSAPKSNSSGPRLSNSRMPANTANES